MGGMSSARSARATRGVIAATFATLVALISHVAGGGAVPGPIGVIAPLILSIAICVWWLPAPDSRLCGSASRSR